MDVYDCHPFQEDGIWYIELWAYLRPSSETSFSLNPYEQSFEKEISRMISQKGIKYIKKSTDIKFHIPKMELSFSALTQVIKPETEVTRDWGKVILPVHIQNKIIAEINE